MRDETARQAFFFSSTRRFNFQIARLRLQSFKCERETFRLLKFKPQIQLRARHDELVQLSSQLLQTDWNWKFDYNTLRYDILDKSDCFSGAKTDIAVGFVPFFGSKVIWQKLGLTFSWKFESCFIEIQYQVTKRCHLLKQTNALELQNP